MPQERCTQCEEHAQMHKGNWGFGPKNKPCKECEEHAELHKRERKVTWW